jgi:CBS domain-containing protein/ribosome-associated translation inhibitor RaiA
MDIADIATTDYTEADVGERFGKIRAAFEESNPRAIVVTDDGEYAGIVTERQILQSHVEDNTKASAFMRSAPRIDRSTGVRDVARMLVEGGTMAAPVFEDDELSGVITTDAILEAVLEHLDAITVDQIYTDDVITINVDTTVGRAINLLREHGISRLPVLADDGRLEGVVTTHDLRDVIIRDMDKATVGDRAGDIERILDIPVYDVMNSPVQTTDREEAVSAAVSRMLEYDYNGLIVTADENDRQVDGVITKTDVLRALTFTEEEHMDVQITNVSLLDTISREDIRADITSVTDKYRRMQVHHAHVRFQKHKEKLRGTPLIQCQIRVRTNRGQVAGSGEGYGADAAFHVALDKLERNVLEMKGIQSDEEYEGQLLRKLNEI